VRRLLLLVVIGFGLVATACQPNPVPPDALARWEARLSHVTPRPDAPALVHAVLNEAIRTGIPIVCPVIVSQAHPDFQPFITGSCNAIATSNDPYTSLIKVLPVLCKGDPPVGALAFPRLATAIEVGCPLLLKIAPMLNIFEAPSAAARGSAPV
jgi:hypothetical protein